MARRMLHDPAARKIVATTLAAAGAYFVIRGALTLADLTAVTHRWIELSGDPDFRWDFAVFRRTIALGSAVVIALGAATAIGGIRTLLGRSWGTTPWLLLAVAAPFVHFPWFIYRVIATGMRPEGAWDVRLFAIRCVFICGLYTMAWMQTRPRRDFQRCL